MDLGKYIMTDIHHTQLFALKSLINFLQLQRFGVLKYILVSGSRVDIHIIQEKCKEALHLKLRSES